MKTNNDKKKIEELIENGYKVVIVNVNGKTFNQRYQVYQAVGFNELKTAIVDRKGNIVGLQG
jgi:tRNA splicing ligase